ncbi:BT_3987 domain-containing protein [Capnocytophaga canimorsus]|uniref:BT_3987 domain-containing protein n=1 Tax=Capnocytophaga canimorsus TaxID=28188 RepID=UPI00385871C1
MKKIILNTLLTTLLLGSVGCQETLDETSTDIKFHNSAYMSLEKATMNVDRKLGGTVEIEPRLALVAKKDEKITISIDDFLKQYNQENTTNFKMLPASEVELYEVENPKNFSKNGSLTITIKEGKISSKVGVKIGVLNPKTYSLGVKYAIPLNIVSTSVKQVLSNNKTLVALQRPVITSVAHIKEGHAPKIKFDPKIPESEEFTLQAFFMFDFFRAYQADTYNMSMLSYNWYSRINPTDVNLADKVREFATDGLEIKTKRWYQVTYVKTKDHRVKIYLDGKHVRTFIMPNVKLKGDTTMSVFNPQMSYSVSHILREVRVWSKALTEAQINADLYNPIDPDSDGLVAYLPIDFENKYNDVTKYENVVELHKATRNSPFGFQDGESYHKIVKPEEYGIDEWHHNVIFPSETLQKVEP